MDTATYPNGQGGQKVNDRPQPNTWHKYSPEKKEKYTRPLLSADTPYEYASMLYELLDIWYNKLHRNKLRYRYYDGKNKLKDFGISTPPELLNVETVVGWPQKAVDALAVRSRFDGFTATNDDTQKILDDLAERSRLRTKYRQAVTSELIYSCAFVTLGSDNAGHAQIDLHSAESASAVWDDAKGRIAYGMVIEDWNSNGEATQIALYTDDAKVTFWLDSDSWFWKWSEERYSMGRPAMEVLAYRPTFRKPLGQSRVSRAVMSLTDAAVRCALGGDISFQFAVAPQKYLLSADASAFKNKTRWEAYIGNIMAVSYNSPDQVEPKFGQLPQASMQQYVDYMRNLAARFSAETNVPLAQLGVNSDANPSSAEAIYAANEPLIIECEDLNEGARESLKNIALMCLAIEYGKSIDNLTDEEKDFTVHFANPAMPSIVSQADAMVKIASAVPDFAGTDLFFEQIGFNEDMRKKAVSDINRNRGAYSLAKSIEDQDAQANISATALRGSQMQALVTVMGQYTSGKLTEGQAINLMATMTGISREDARGVLNGTIDLEELEQAIDESVDSQLQTATEEIADADA